MKKNKKIVIALVGIFVVAAIVAAVIFFVIPNFDFSNKNLKDEEYTKELENMSEGYVDNESSVIDESGNIRNISSKLSLEKFVADGNVGMYGFKVTNNEDETSTVEFTVKNHSNTKINSFKYRLQFINADGSILGTIDLETKKLPSLGKYNIKIKLNKDIIDVYDIVPVTDFENYGNLGGGLIEA